MNTIKVKFVDFWRNFDLTKSRLFNFLNQKYNVVLSDDPDYLFYSVYGFEHLKYDCVKICFTGENVVPDFNFCDYGVGFHYLQFPGRYIRVPLFAKRDTYKSLKYPPVIDPEEVLNRKFCNFLYSNRSTANPVRELLFNRLSRYKQVDSGGRLLNNTGYRTDNKLSFISGYKFTIAFENSSVDGYTTEKLVDPMSVNSLPIYWGNPLVHKDFNTMAFIHLKNSTTVEIDKAIEQVIHLDTHDDEYLTILSKPRFKESQFIDADKRQEAFLDLIFSQPITEARRRPEFGYHRYNEKRLKELVYKPPLSKRLVKRLKKMIRRIIPKQG